MAVVRPLRELDLADELRLDPHDVARPHLRHLGDDGERRRLAAQRLEQLQQRVDVPVGEAGAAVADPVQLAAAVRAEHERAEPAGAAALSGRPAADDELLLLVRLDLQPVPVAPSLGVPRAGALGHHALEALLLGGGLQRLAVVEHRRQPDRAVALVEQRLEPRPPLRQRQVDHRLAVQLQQVEDLVDERRPRLSLLHRREARPPLLVERAHLAVDDALRAADRLCQLLRHLGEAAGEIVAVAGDELRLAAADIAERAIAVPLHLEDPVVAARERLGERGEHRRVLAARPARRGAGRVRLAQQQPVPLLAAELRRDERPGPFEALAVQPHGQAAVGLLLHELVGAPVPDLDRAGAVVPLRDLAFEARVVERMILDMDGQDAHARLERHALRHGPRGERPVALEPEVVVEVAGVVALDDEDRIARPATLRAERLRRLRPVALALVLAELVGHPGSLPVRHTARKERIFASLGRTHTLNKADA